MNYVCMTAVSSRGCHRPAVGRLAGVTVPAWPALLSEPVSMGTIVTPAQGLAGNITARLLGVLLHSKRLTAFDKYIFDCSG